MNWKLLIADLSTVGKLSQPRIAALVGCAQASISDIARGVTKDPRHSLGEALRALHAQVMAGQPAAPASQEPAHAEQGA